MRRALLPFASLAPSAIRRLRSRRGARARQLYCRGRALRARRTLTARPARAVAMLFFGSSRPFPSCACERGEQSLRTDRRTGIVWLTVRRAGFAPHQLPACCYSTVINLPDSVSMSTTTTHMGRSLVKCYLCRNCTFLLAPDPRPEPVFKLRHDDCVHSHSVGHRRARTLIPHSRGHRAQEGWDQSFCDGVLRPRRATIATRLDPTGLPLWLSRGWDDLTIGAAYRSCLEFGTFRQNTLRNENATVPPIACVP
jgi:hypothetical protein